MHSRTQPLAFPLAALLGAALAPACGGGGGSGPDATADDASTIDSGPPADAPVPDAVPPGPATVTINDPEGTPVEGLDVVFHDESGAVISLQATDESGEATEIVPGGALITLAFSPEAGVFQLFTLGDVQPGDDIVVSDFGAQEDEEEPTEAGTVSIEWPGPFDGADGHQVTEGCNTQESAAADEDSELAVSTACQHGEEAFHVIAQAYANGEGQFDPPELLATSHLLDQDIQGGNQTLSLPDWSDQIQSASGTMMNAPGGAAFIGGDGNFVLDGITYDMMDSTLALGSAPGVEAKVPEGITPEAVNLIGAAVFLSGTMSLSGLNVVQVNTAGLPESDVDVDFAEAPRPATNGTFDPSDPARPILSWDAEGTGDATDLTQLALTWTGTVGGGDSQHSWNVFTTPDENGPFQFPELPSELSDFAPTNDTTFDSVNMNYLSASFVTEDWDTLRQQGVQPAAEEPETDFVVGFSFPDISMATAPGPAPRSESGPAGRFLRWGRELLPTE